MPKQQSRKSDEARQRADGNSLSPFTTKVLVGGETRKSLVQLVHETLLEGFDEGTFKPGERIKAAELANRLGLSRAPVREALHVLAGQGLVELLPDRGAILRTMSLSDLIGIYEVSGPVAAIGIAEAARKIDEGNNASRVKAGMNAIREAGRRTPSYEFYEPLDEYHYIVNEIANKPYVTYLMKMLNLDYWHRFLAANINLGQNIPRYVANYERLTDSLLAGDWRGSEAIMLGHTQWAMSQLAHRVECQDR